MPRDDPSLDDPRAPHYETFRRRRRMRAIGAIAFVTLLAGLISYAQAGDDASRSRRRSTGGGGAPPCPEVEVPEASPPTFESPPELALADGVDYAAIVHTSCGDIEFDLLEEAAPRTVANFVFLAEQRFFDGLPWPRIERDFVIQTGDPDGVIGTDVEGPGYTIPDELPKSGREYVYGTVAMANDGPGTGGSQFFIVVHDPTGKTEPAGIEPEYSIFGKVAEASYETLHKIAAMPIEGGVEVPSAVRPRSPVVIESVEIVAAS